MRGKINKTIGFFVNAPQFFGDEGPGFTAQVVGAGMRILFRIARSRQNGY